VADGSWGCDVSTEWVSIPTALGHALWSALRPRLGIDVTVYESATDVDGGYYLTAVGTSDGSTPLLRCESRCGVHWFCVPAPMVCE
jgi:hypothetical protein